MALMQWDETLSVNVSEIDKQHIKLLGMLNELYDAMQQGKGRVVVGKILDGLTNYVVTHFATEEKYFDKFNYPEAKEHKNEHAALVKKVSDFKGEFEKGRITLSIDLMNFLKEWLIKHIMGTDKKYGPFFNEKGLK